MAATVVDSAHEQYFDEGKTFQNYVVQSYKVNIFEVSLILIVELYEYESYWLCLNRLILRKTIQYSYEVLRASNKLKKLGSFSFNNW